jgi:hypothetical protein
VKIVRELRDGTDKRFEVVVYVREQGDVFERAILQLASKARDSKGGTATDAFGIVEVSVHPIGESK